MVKTLYISVSDFGSIAEVHKWKPRAETLLKCWVQNHKEEAIKYFRDHNYIIKQEKVKTADAVKNVETAYMDEVRRIRPKTSYEIEQLQIKFEPEIKKACDQDNLSSIQQSHVQEKMQSTIKTSFGIISEEKILDDTEEKMEKRIIEKAKETGTAAKIALEKAQQEAAACALEASEYWMAAEKTQTEVQMYNEEAIRAKQKAEITTGADSEAEVAKYRYAEAEEMRAKKRETKLRLRQRAAEKQEIAAKEAAIESQIEAERAQYRETNAHEYARITQRNSKMYYKTIFRDDNYIIKIGGRVDGISEDMVIEAKNRMKEYTVRKNKYDLYQLMGYMYLTNTPRGKLVQRFNNRIWDSDVPTTREWGIVTLDERWTNFYENKLLPFFEELKNPIQVPETISKPFLIIDENNNYCPSVNNEIERDIVKLLKV